MKKSKRFLAAAICTLLSVLFVFSANVLASETSLNEGTDSYYERVSDSDYGDSGGWIEDNEDESMKGDYEQEYKEKAGESDDEYESNPSDSEDESSTEEPSGGGDFPPVQEDEYL
jgi:hypothetical protein